MWPQLKQGRISSAQNELFATDRPGKLNPNENSPSYQERVSSSGRWSEMLTSGTSKSAMGSSGETNA